MESVHEINEIPELYKLKTSIDIRISQLEEDRTISKTRRAVTNKGYYMEKALMSNLNFLLERKKLHWDNLLIIDGDERAGKSTLARQIGYYIYYDWYKDDPERLEKFYNAENIFFDPEEVLSFAKSHREEVIIWDEAALGALSEDRFNEVQQVLIKLLMVCGKYGHFLIFVLPKMKRLAPYFVEDRAIGLIRIGVIGNIQRGSFYGYSKKKMIQLYNYEKRNYGKKPFADFRGKFLNYENTPKECIDIVKYEKGKDKAIMNLDFKTRKKDKSLVYLSILVNHVKKQKWMKKKDMAHLMNVNGSYLSNLPTIEEE